MMVLKDPGQSASDDGSGPEPSRQDAAAEDEATGVAASGEPMEVG